MMSTNYSGGTATTNSNGFLGWEHFLSLPLAYKIRKVAQLGGLCPQSSELHPGKTAV